MRSKVDAIHTILKEQLAGAGQANIRSFPIRDTINLTLELVTIGKRISGS